MCDPATLRMGRAYSTSNKTEALCQPTESAPDRNVKAPQRAALSVRHPCKQGIERGFLESRELEELGALRAKIPTDMIAVVYRCKAEEFLGVAYTPVNKVDVLIQRLFLAQDKSEVRITVGNRGGQKAWIHNGVYIDEFGEEDLTDDFKCALRSTTIWNLYNWLNELPWKQGPPDGPIQLLTTVFVEDTL